MYGCVVEAVFATLLVILINKGLAGPFILSGEIIHAVFYIVLEVCVVCHLVLVFQDMRAGVLRPDLQALEELQS